MEGQWMLDYEVTQLLAFASRSGRSRPGALPVAPDCDVVKSKSIPPEIKHGLIEPQDSFLRNTGRRRRKLLQSVVHEGSLSLFFDARQQMPQAECVVWARLAKHNREVRRTLLRSAVVKIESRQSG